MSEQIPSWAADLIKQAEPNPRMPLVHYDLDGKWLEVIWRLESYNRAYFSKLVDRLIGKDSGEIVGLIFKGISWTEQQAKEPEFRDRAVFKKELD